MLADDNQRAGRDLSALGAGGQEGALRAACRGPAKFGVRRLAAALLRPGLPGRVMGRAEPRPMKARPGSRTPYEAKKRPARQHCGGPWPPKRVMSRRRLIATDHPTRLAFRVRRGGMVILSPPQAEESRLLRSGRIRGPKELSFGQFRKPKITTGTQAKKRRVATFTNSKFDLTDSQHARYGNSSRNKFALFGNEPAVQEAESRLEAGGTKSKATSKKRQPAGRQRYIKQKDEEQILIDRMPIRNRCNSLKTNDGGDF
jgi:hypothetical protein